MKIYDITATISEDLPAFGTGSERHTITHQAQMDEGAPYNFSWLSVSAHTGTHADMPLHFIAGGTNCTDTPLEHFYGPAKVMRISVNANVRKADLEGLDIQAGDIILLDTGQSRYMSQANFKEDFFALTPEAAEYLVEKKIKTVGIDYLSIDPYRTPGYPAHKVLLGGGVAVLEGLVLEGVPEGTYTLSALPLKIAKGEGSPVRAILIGG